MTLKALAAVAWSVVGVWGAQGRDVWKSEPLGSLKIGGRIALIANGNHTKIGYDKVFVEPFRLKDGQKSFVGTGNQMVSLVLLAMRTGDADLLAPWPESAKPIADNRARSGGTAIRVKRPLESLQLDPDCAWVRLGDFTFTESPAPANTLNCFRLPGARGATVDDESMI